MSDANAASALPLATARVAGFVPGRVRLRFAPTVEGRRLLTEAATELAAHGELVAHPRQRSASLVVEYEPIHGDAVWERLSGLGLRAGAGDAAAPPVAEPSARVSHAVRHVDGWVAGRTGGHELRTLVPLGLAMLAARQALRDEQRLSEAPWYVLAWYASETWQRFKSTRGARDG